MGEKSGGLTNMIIAMVALVAIILIVKVAFPEMVTTITTTMKDIIGGSVDELGTIMLGAKYL